MSVHFLNFSVCHDDDDDSTLVRAKQYVADALNRVLNRGFNLVVAVTYPIDKHLILPLQPSYPLKLLYNYLPTSYQPV